MAGKTTHHDPKTGHVGGRSVGFGSITTLFVRIIFFFFLYPSKHIVHCHIVRIHNFNGDIK